jgi:hypothetical protein
VTLTGGLAGARYWSEMRSVGIKAGLVAIVAFTMSANPAGAQDGVFIDPDSPSGKEYEIPLETVRRGAQPGTDPSAPISQGERSAAPFGEGIGGDPRNRDSPGTGSGGGRENDGGQDGGSGGSEDRRRDRDSASGASGSAVIEAAANNPGAPPSSPGSTLLYLGAGALVLALGVGVGLLLRRRQSHEPF